MKITVASPCPASWEKMIGDDRTRFCEQCRLNVYNVSAMSETEAAAFLGSVEGRVCVRLYQRSDGTILTADCPIGKRRKLRSRILIMAAFLGLAVIGWMVAGTDSNHPHAYPSWLVSILRFFGMDVQVVQGLMG